MGTLVVVAGGAWATAQAGRFLASDDRLERADAIVVLAGSVIERPLEAADLYREGYAPIIVLTRDMPEPAVETLQARRIVVATPLDLARGVLLQLGIPAQAILAPERIHDNTAEEAQTVRQLAVSRGWTRVIVVSSKYHLRRAGLALRRELRNSGVSVIMRGSRYDPADPARWWRRRRDIRWLASEVPKLVAYALGLGA